MLHNRPKDRSKIFPQSFWRWKSKLIWVLAAQRGLADHALETLVVRLDRAATGGRIRIAACHANSHRPLKSWDLDQTRRSPRRKLGWPISRERGDRTGSARKAPARSARTSHRRCPEGFWRRQEQVSAGPAGDQACPQGRW